jgi:uncharacterized membrane protein
MGINWAEHTIEIEAPIETCFTAIVDYESFPRWQSSVISTEVLSRDGEGLGERVRLFLSAKGQRIDYTLDYSYERPAGISWEFVEGHGVKDVDGVYSFDDLGGARTRATYRLGIDPTLPIPGIVARRIHAQALKKSVEELRDEAERRHREEPAPPPEGEPRAAEPEPAPEPEAAPGPEAAPEPRAAESEPAAAEPDPERRPAEPPEPERGESPSPSGGPAERALGDTASAARELAGAAIGVAQAATGAGLSLARGAAGAALGVGREAVDRLTDRIEGALRDQDEERGGD